MAGLKVVPVKTHADGNLDLEDLKTKAEKHKDQLAAFMVRTRVFVHTITQSRLQYLQITYPSTFGVFEHGVQDVSAIFAMPKFLVDIVTAGLQDHPQQWRSGLPRWCQPQRADRRHQPCHLWR